MFEDGVGDLHGSMGRGYSKLLLVGDDHGNVHAGGDGKVESGSESEEDVAKTTTVWRGDGLSGRTVQNVATC